MLLDGVRVSVGLGVSKRRGRGRELGRGRRMRRGSSGEGNLRDRGAGSFEGELRKSSNVTNKRGDGRRSGGRWRGV